MDDFLTKKRESGSVLDFSKATATTKEEFRKLFDKVPDYKLKPEKVRPEDIKIRDNLKKMKFKTGKKDFKAARDPFTFQDPIPVEMKNLKIDELASVPIDWKMLTSVRPKNKVDEDFYSRIIYLRKLEQKTEAKDKTLLAIDPQIKKIKNKAGVIELRPLNCSECFEDFCTGKACKFFNYEAFARVPEIPKAAIKKPEVSKDKKKRRPKKKERKPRSPAKKQKKKREKSKSPKKNK